jgi:hypothetical protein
MLTVMLIVFSSSLRGTHAKAATLVELDRIASRLIAVSGYEIGVTVNVSRAKSKGVAAIYYSGSMGSIYVDPSMLRSLGSNTWAFILGHELSHLILGGESGELKNNESTADGVGALMAKQAGYDLRSYIIWMYSNPNTCSLTHGCFHSRARELENFYGINTGYFAGSHSDHPEPRGLPRGGSCH